MDRGWDTDFAALLEKIGGRWSGPAAEFVLSFLRTLKMISGEIVISMRGGLDGGSRDENGGRMPLSWVNTEWKYSLRSSALFSTDVRNHRVYI